MLCLSGMWRSAASMRSKVGYGRVKIMQKVGRHMGNV